MAAYIKTEEFEKEKTPEMFLAHRCIYTKDYNDKVIATKEDYDNCCTQCYEDVVQALDKEAFFKNEPADKVDAFAKLFIACNRLAAFTNATVDATLYPDDNSVSIFIASRIFYFGINELSLLHRISFFATEMNIAADKNRESVITVDYSFDENSASLNGVFDDIFELDENF